MIVCLCEVVSDRAIRAAREAGAHTVEAMAAATGAGSGCGCCHGAIAKILAEPCRPVPCAGCPRRADAPDGVPARIAAEQVKAP
ncbi:MAG TPA: (2Fe-2S)-binding protein [Anaeromyxobacter sp.]|nr:(2Fe-2S)-binding protein [Anaeromyxobacter sp.]